MPASPRCAVFCEVRASASPSAALDDALARALAAGRAAWPGVAVDDASFVRHLAERVDDGDPAKAVEALGASDLYLACACASGSSAAVEVFSRRLLAVADVRAMLSSLGAAPLADDVRQILLERLFVGSPGSPPRIASYSGRGSLAGWVRVSAVRVAVSLRRREHPAQAPSEEALDPLLPAVDPELDALKLRYAAAFNAALRDAFAALSPRDRTLLRLHYVDGVSVERIASSYNAHRVSASRWLSAARGKVLEETTRLLRERKRLSESEFESLARLVQSQLEVSLRSAIGEAG
jgi:RNA polymerase sigma-70 factor (ECF subfamily)